MIQITDLKKSFRTEEVETLALNGVNLSVEEGEFVAVMGPSGCGKSTLLNIIGMLDNPTEGSYNFAGHEVAGLKESQRTQLRKGNLGFVFQSFNLIPVLTARENVALPLQLQGMTDWGLEFAMAVTFIGIVVPMLLTRPMVLAAFAAGAVAVLARDWPHQLGLMAGAGAGVAAGMLAQRAAGRKASGQGNGSPSAGAVSDD